MNKKDKKEVEALLNERQNMKTRMEEIGATLGELGEAEREKFDNMPEGLQGGDRGQAMEEAAGNLSSAADALESGSLEEALEALGQIEGLEV